MFNAEANETAVWRMGRDALPTMHNHLATIN